MAEIELEEHSAFLHKKKKKNYEIMEEEREMDPRHMKVSCRMRLLSCFLNRLEAFYLLRAKEMEPTS